MMNTKVVFSFLLIVLVWGSQSLAQTSTYALKKPKVPIQTGISGNFGYADQGDNIAITAYYGTGDVSIPLSINEKPVTSIERSVFYSKPEITRVLLSSSISELGDQNFVHCLNLKSIDVDSGNPSFSSQDGVLFNKDKTVLIKYPPGLEGPYTIPSGVTHIMAYAFYSCENVSRVITPSNLSVIGDRAFYRCVNLEEVTSSSNLTEIGAYAFCECISLEKVSFPVGVKEIGLRAFSGCAVLVRADFSGNAPRFGVDVFAGVADNFSIYYQTGKTGFTSPTWAGYPCKEMASALDNQYLVKGSLASVRFGTKLNSSSLEDLRAKKISKGSFSRNSIASRIAMALSAESGGSVDLKDLVLDRSPYIGKVVRLRGDYVDFHSSSHSGASHISMWDSRGDITLSFEIADDKDGREWAMEADQNDSGGRIYVFVEENSLLALGVRKKKVGKGFEYSW